MSLPEEDREWIELMFDSKLKSVSELLTELKTTIWGRNGDNGLVGTQREHSDKLEEHTKAIGEAKTNIAVIGTDIKAVKKMTSALLISVLGMIFAVVAKMFF